MKYERGKAMKRFITVMATVAVLFAMAPSVEAAPACEIPSTWRHAQWNYLLDLKHKQEKLFCDTLRKTDFPIENLDLTIKFGSTEGDEDGGLYFPRERTILIDINLLMDGDPRETFTRQLGYAVDFQMLRYRYRAELFELRTERSPSDSYVAWGRRMPRAGGITWLGFGNGVGDWFADAFTEAFSDFDQDNVSDEEAVAVREILSPLL